MGNNEYFVDERRKPYIVKDKNTDLSFCIYCGEIADSREHVPSKALGDGENIVVPSCKKCNNEFSYDEKYLSYVIKELIGNQAEMNDENLKNLVHDELLGNGYFCDYNFQYDRIKAIFLKISYGHLISEFGIVSKGFYELFKENALCKIYLENLINQQEREEIIKLYKCNYMSELWGRESIIIASGQLYYYWKNRGENYHYMVAMDETSYIIKINICDKIYGIIEVPIDCFN